MPLLAPWKRRMPLQDGELRLWQESGIDGQGERDRDSVLVGHCSNPSCCSGWLQLFRSRTHPVFERGWTCSGECTRQRLETAVRREVERWAPDAEPHQHRIPLGLVMLERGWITSQQLRRALTAQRSGGRLRLGEWLVKQGATTELLVSRALSLQWGCPVLPASGLIPRPELLPRLFVEAFGAVPVQDSSGRVLYLGFEQTVDTALAFAAERIAGKRVECGIVPSSSYFELLGRVGEQRFPQVQVAEAVSESAAAYLLAKSIEREQPIDSRLVRTHEWLWLRMVVKGHGAGASGMHGIRDLVCRIGPF